MKSKVFRPGWKPLLNVKLCKERNGRSKFNPTPVKTPFSQIWALLSEDHCPTITAVPGIRPVRSKVVRKVYKPTASACAFEVREIHREELLLATHGGMGKPSLVTT